MDSFWDLWHAFFSLCMLYPASKRISESQFPVQHYPQRLGEGGKLFFQLCPLAEGALRAGPQRRNITFFTLIVPSTYATTPMLMIAAALEEELETAKSLCTDCRMILAEKAKLWQAVRKGRSFCFLRAGVGPKRSAERLEEALKLIRPAGILVIGYAGALDPELKLGSLVAVRKAVAFSLDDNSPDWGRVRVDGEFELENCQCLADSAKSAGLIARTGDTLTSSHVLGDPEHKRLLYEKFHASIVDMETAALARVAGSEAIPLSCIRAVSDEAQDTFLAPFSFDPSTGIPARAMKLIGTGMVETYREWKTHSSAAKESLSRFLSRYL
jgi:nucleoside phosphorylase